MLGHACCSFIIICLAARTDGINTTVSLHLSFSLRSSLLSYILLLFSFPFPGFTPSLSRTPHFLLMLIYFLLVLAALLSTLHLHHGFISHNLCRGIGVLGLLSMRQRWTRLSIHWLRLDKGRMR